MKDQKNIVPILKEKTTKKITVRNKPFREYLHRIQFPHAPELDLREFRRLQVISEHVDWLKEDIVLVAEQALLIKSNRSYFVRINPEFHILLNGPEEENYFQITINLDKYQIIYRILLSDLMQVKDLDSRVCRTVSEFKSYLYDEIHWFESHQDQIEYTQPKLLNHA